MKVDIEKLERLDKEATPGKWEDIYPNVDDGDIRIQIYSDDNRNCIRDIDTIASKLKAYDARLIATLRNMLPDIIAELKESRKKIAIGELFKIFEELEQYGREGLQECHDEGCMDSEASGAYSGYIECCISFLEKINERFQTLD